MQSKMKPYVPWVHSLWDNNRAAVGVSLGKLSHPPTHFALLFALQKESCSAILSLVCGCDEEAHPDKCCWISLTFKTPAGCKRKLLNRLL